MKSRYMNTANRCRQLLADVIMTMLRGFDIRNPFAYKYVNCCPLCKIWFVKNRKDQVPNFIDSFYDDKYEEMKHLIYEYAPNESIIGRLISDKQKIIVMSNSTLLGQHNGYTWLVEEDHFVHTESYNETSNKIAKVTGDIFHDLDNNTKSAVINVIFDAAEKIDFKLLKDSDNPIEVVTDAIKNLKSGCKSIQKEKRKVVTSVVTSIILIIVQNNKLVGKVKSTLKPEKNS